MRSPSRCHRARISARRRPSSVSSSRPDTYDRSPIVHFYEIPNAPVARILAGYWRRLGFEDGPEYDASGALTFEFWNNPCHWLTSILEHHGRTCPCPGDWRRYSGDAGHWQSPGRRIVSTMAVWRAGRVGQADLPYPLIGAQATWQTTFAASSPDGRYVLRQLVIAGCAVAGIAKGPKHRPPILLARDAGFAHIMRSIPQYVPGAAQPLIYVAWRPDGKAIATFDLANNQKLTIYDRATGRCSHPTPSLRNPRNLMACWARCAGRPTATICCCLMARY